MDLLINKCTGCGLCANICPMKAITMCENGEGFLYPIINEQNCDSCNLCNTMCDEYRDQGRDKNKPLKVQACQTKDAKWLIESTAGGFFPTLAQWVIEQGGVVFGTAYDEAMNPVVCKAESVEDILRFNGSKYVQSDLTEALPVVKAELDQGKWVLFSGTPCQLAAVKTLCKDYIGKKLITMDVVCYGVPSPGLFREFLKCIEKDKQARVVDYRFRDKHRHGWSHTTVITMLDVDGNQIHFEEEDYSKIPYYKMFGTRNCFRKECYSCQYNTIERISDFTTGNFWGIEKMTDKFDATKGVSMVLMNTAIAARIFEKISDRFETIDMTIDQAIQANDALVHTCKYPSERDDIYHCFQSYGFEATYKKFYSDGTISRLKRKMRIVLKKFLNTGRSRRE